MRRASIGLGVLVVFFILAMFLMADAEVPSVDNTPVTAGAAAR